MSLSEDPNLADSAMKANTVIAEQTFLGRLTSSYTQWTNSIRWIQTSDLELELCENKIFSYLKSKFKTYYVDVSETVEEEDGKKKRRCCKVEERKIWTIEMDDPKTGKTPILLVHGFAAAIGFWTLNLDSLAKQRKVYAIDLIGFGRSTRPDLSKKEHPEDDIVDSIERWRENVGLNQKFIILGHSFGGFIASSYCIKYKDKVDRLILADAWGFSEDTVDKELVKKVPTWVKAIFRVSFFFNPLSIIRVTGPWGNRLVSYRDDLRRKFVPLMGEDGSKEILNYVYHCNAGKPSGESVFKKLCTPQLSAKRPIILRANEISKDIKLNFVYANRSWLLREEESKLREIFPEHKLDYKIIEDAGHHVYSDNAPDFNEYINNLE